MNLYKQICWCEHDIDTHHEKKYACTAAHCDCREYAAEKPARVEAVPDTERSVWDPSNWKTFGWNPWDPSGWDTGLKS